MLISVCRLRDCNFDCVNDCCEACALGGARSARGPARARRLGSGSVPPGLRHALQRIHLLSERPSTRPATSFSTTVMNRAVLSRCQLCVVIAAVLCSAATAVPAVATAADEHPTLPTAWTAIVEEEGVGTVWESYLMNTRPSPENPSGKWTNFTDDPNEPDACRRLIYVTGTKQVRYYLKCHAVDCCYDDTHEG